MLTIGIDLGGTNIKGALVDRVKGIIKSYSIPTDAEKGKDHVINQVARVIQMAADDAPTKPLAAGVGSPGVISFDRTTVSNPPNFPGWEKENLAELLKEKTGFDCYVDNDANLMALGSSYFGSGKSFDSFLMVTLGTGVGGGIIYQNKLFRGATGGAAEFGHVIIDYNGPEDMSPAKGGIEAYLGQRFLSRHAWEVIKKHPDNALFEQFKHAPDTLEPVHLSMEADRGNRIAIDILKTAGERLGIAIVNYIHILDIRKVIISGGVSKAGDWILKPAKEMADNRLIHAFREDFEIIYESLGNHAAVLGAASLPYEYINR
jgi:glucokinase